MRKCKWLDTKTRNTTSGVLQTVLGQTLFRFRCGIRVNVDASKFLAYFVVSSSLFGVTKVMQIMVGPVI